MKRYLLLFMFMASTSTLFCSQPKQRIIVNNRVIAKVNGNPISVVDLMKKMDLMFYQEHAGQLDSSEMRYHYYQANWKEVLMSMIDRELVVKDAEEQGIPVTAGDIREEVEEIFGPDVLANLEEAGLTYEEASKLVRQDILIRRMLSYSVNMKALKKVTPEEIVRAYEEARQQMYQDQFHFRIISIKSENGALASSTAQAAAKALNDERISVESLQNHLENKGLLQEAVMVTVSPVFVQKKSEFSPNVCDILMALDEGMASTPASQKGGLRLYFMEKKEQQEPPALEDIEEKIREKLVGVAMNEESTRYFNHLRKHYDVKPDEILAGLPANFTPFEIK